MAEAILHGRVGVGFKPDHAHDLFDSCVDYPQSPGWIEIHPENYLSAGGPALSLVERLAERWPLSFHSVGLSIGSCEGLDAQHLARICTLYRRVHPFLMSVHLAWSRSGSRFINDLLPLPLTPETLGIVSQNIDCLQQALGCPILIENPSSYVMFKHSTFSEPDFLYHLVDITGCHLLLDLNNAVVTCHNTGMCLQDWIAAFPLESVREIHLAGHTESTLEDGTRLKIDDHGCAISAAVLSLLADTSEKCTAPILIEWDTNVPPFRIVMGELMRVHSLLQREPDVAEA